MPLRLSLAFAFLLAEIGASAAQEKWSLSPLDSASLPREIVEETRALAAGGLPDGLVEVYDGPYSGRTDIASAWYAGPTKRYRHAVLCDGIEASALVVRTSAGEERTLALPETEVFEDRTPRLADLDGDGKLEVVTIRSSTSLGASVTVYGLAEDRLVERASTGFIGLANRWLNIAGIAGFRGLRGKEVAFVRTPHIGGTLFIYAYADGALTQVGRLTGFSNHRIGSRELRLSAVADVNGDGRMDLAVPSDNRRRLRIVGFADVTAGDAADKVLVELAFAELPSPIDKAIAVRGSGKEVSFVVGLENAQVYEVHR